MINILFIMHWVVCKHDYNYTMVSLAWKNNLADNMLRDMTKGYNELEYEFILMSASNLAAWLNIEPQSNLPKCIAFIKRYEEDRKRFIKRNADKLLAQRVQT